MDASIRRSNRSTEAARRIWLSGFVALFAAPTAWALGPPLPAPFPHDRLKNRYISFDPNKADNGDTLVAFQIEIKSIAMGSCSGPESAPCRYEQGEGLNEPGDNDCRRCSDDNEPCIRATIDCIPNTQSCDLSGETCSNDDPASGGTNLGLIRWVGPADPIHGARFLAVTEAFREVRLGDDWPDVIHVGDCEIVPQAEYGVRTVDVGLGTESAELLVATQVRPANGVYAWYGDAVGALTGYCNDGDIRAQTCLTNADCTIDPGPCVLAWTESNGHASTDDILAARDLFVATGAAPRAPYPPGVPPTPGVPDITWVDLHGAEGGQAYTDPPEGRCGTADIQNILNAFTGRPYPYSDPADCPDVGAWP